MKKIFYLTLVISLAFACCKSVGKKSMKGDEKIDAADFIAFFNDLNLPISYFDSVFSKKPADTALIENIIFEQFISDSIFKTDFGTEAPKVYATGKFSNGKEEIYLLFRAVSKKKQVLYVAALNKKNEFSAAIPLISSSGSTGSEKVTIDPKYTFTHTTFTKAADGSMSPVNTVYAYNTAGLFMVILTDGVPAGTELPILDPIDTLPRNGKWSGNYVKDKRNLLSIRDAPGSQQFIFFIHIEKKGSRFCDGELKAEAKIVGADSATSTGNGEPCVLGFKFKGNTVRITETNCGSRHGAECSFSGSYARSRKPGAGSKK